MQRSTVLSLIILLSLLGRPAKAQDDLNVTDRWPTADGSSSSGLSSRFPIEQFLAKHGDFGRAAKRITPDIELSGYYVPDAEFSSDDEEIDLLRYEIDALIPLPVTEDTFLIFGGHAGARDYKISSPSGYEDERVYNLGLRFGAGTFINDDFAVQGYWQPSIYSDLGGPPYSDDWKLWYGAGLAVYRTSPTFFWKGGFALTQAQNTGIIPLVGAAWLFAPKWRIDVLIPRSGEISYRPNENWDLHAAVRLDAEKYRIRQDELQGGTRKNIKVQDLRWYVGALHKFDFGLSVFARAGIAYGGEYDWSEEFEGHMKPAPFVSSGIGWHF